MHWQRKAQFSDQVPPSSAVWCRDHSLDLKATPFSVARQSFFRCIYDIPSPSGHNTAKASKSWDFQSNLQDIWGQGKISTPRELMVLNTTNLARQYIAMASSMEMGKELLTFLLGRVIRPGLPRDFTCHFLRPPTSQGIRGCYEEGGWLRVGFQWSRRIWFSLVLVNIPQ